MVKGLLQDKKVPRTSTGTRVTAAPSPWLLGLLQDFWESWVNNSLPCQTSLEQHRERPGCLKLQGGEYGRSGKHTETVGASWGELRVWPCGALTRTVLSLAGEGGCVRGQALLCMERQDWAGGFSQKEKDPRGQFGEISWNNSSSLLATWLPGAHAGLWGTLSPNPKHRVGGVHTTPNTSTGQGECNSETWDQRH